MSIAVIIPCYKVKKHILSVISKIGSEVERIIVVDDLCPEKTGVFVEAECKDPRVLVLFHAHNQGVGGATLTGYEWAFQLGCEVAVKVDGDDQMDISLLPQLVRPILENKADYCKGNRFFYIESLQKMPGIRILGNAVLSFLSKFSTGYYYVFDPTNGYTALKLQNFPRLNAQKISKRYFFESDILFRLNLIDAVVADIAMPSIYGDEVSNLRISKIILPFLWGHARNFVKRITYKYYLRDFSIASLELLVGSFLFSSGVAFGLYEWKHNYDLNQAATAGTVGLAMLPIIMGFQLLLSFLNFDILQSRNISKN